MKNTKIKRLLAFLLALCLLTAALPLSVSAAEYSGSCGADLEWTIADDTLTITGTGKMNDIPLGSDPPWDKFRDSFTKIVIESGVTTVGDNTFCDLGRITEVTLPDTLTSIGSSAFINCKALQGITIPSCTRIGYSAFRMCESLSYVILPENLTFIGEYAFSYTTSLKQVDLPSKVSKIEMAAFSGSGLTSISIPGTAELGIQVFEYAPLESVEIKNGVDEIPMNMFFNCKSLKTISIPGSVKTIGASVFEGCVSLSDVTIEKGLTEVIENAFRGCTSLEEITFPSTLKKCNSPFRDTNVKTVTFLSKDCEIKGTLGTPGITVIRGYKGSTAETFARASGYAFEALEGEPETPVSFTDVKVGDFFYDSVMWAVENEITSGTSATTFSPNKTCTRADAMTFLWRAAGKPEPSSTVNPFSDVKPDAYYYKAVLWAVENKITAGVSADRFGSSNTCTRGQIMTFLYRLAGSPSISSRNPFTDVAEGKSYYNAVLWAVEEGITAGTTATTFSPNSSCKRGQIVTFLYRYYV